MNRTASGVVYGLVMVAIIVGVDLAFLRHQPWLRLAVNVSIVLLFGVGYFIIFRRRG